MRECRRDFPGWIGYSANGSDGLEVITSNFDSADLWIHGVIADGNTQFGISSWLGAGRSVLTISDTRANGNLHGIDAGSQGINGNGSLYMRNVTASGNAGWGIWQATATGAGLGWGSALVDLRDVTADNNWAGHYITSITDGAAGNATIIMDGVSGTGNTWHNAWQIIAAAVSGNADITMTDSTFDGSKTAMGLSFLQALSGGGAGYTSTITMNNCRAHDNALAGFREINLGAPGGGTARLTVNGGSANNNGQLGYFVDVHQVADGYVWFNGADAIGNGGNGIFVMTRTVRDLGYISFINVNSSFNNNSGIAVQQDFVANAAPPATETHPSTSARSECGRPARRT